MFGIIGIVVVLVCVFGGYILAGGKMTIIIKALPFELMIIGGSAAGTFITANGTATLGKAAKSFAKVFSGPKFKQQDYVDVLCLMFALLKLTKTKGVIAVEPHIEKPADSKLFQAYPKIAADHFALDLICDSMRMLTMGMDDPHQFEEIVNKEIEKHHHDVMRAQSALQTVADACPALGIVAAVMGVIKTMASINEPPEILGKMIGGALVGTFLGVFLAYGIVGPFASRVKSVIEEDQHFYNLIREVMVAALHNHAPNVCVEVGRQNTPHHVRPSYGELEEALKNVKSEAA